jgi:hypothetical protein
VTRYTVVVTLRDDGTPAWTLEEFKVEFNNAMTEIGMGIEEINICEVVKP